MQLQNQVSEKIPTLLHLTKLMKETFLLFMILSATGYYGISQNAFGVKAGANIADQYRRMSLAQNVSKKTKPLPGYQLGAFYKRHMNSRLDLSVEANLSLIGARVSYVTEEHILNPDGKSHYFNDKIGYIDIPVALQYHFNDFYLMAGPNLALKVFSRVTNFENRSFSGFNYRKIDAGGNFGAGYNMSKRLGVNLRYYHGLLNIAGSDSYLKIRNRFVNLSMLYYFKSK